MATSVSLLVIVTAFVSLYYTNGGYGLRNVPNDDPIEENLCTSDNNPLNKTINLLPGVVYAVSPGDYCKVESVSELTIRGQSSSNHSVIHCLHDDDIISRGFAFVNAQNVMIENVDFRDCGTILPKDLLVGRTNSSAFYFGPGQASVLFCNNCSNFTMHNVTINNYTGYALVVMNSQGNILLDGVDISNNNKQHNISQCHSPGRTYVCKGSGVLFMLIEKPSLPSVITVNHSTFHNNTADHAIVDRTLSTDCTNAVFDHLNSAFKVSYVLPTVGAITAIVDRITLQDVKFKIVGSHFIDNHGECYGAVVGVFLSQSNASALTFSGCTFRDNTPSIVLETEEGRNYFGSDITLYLKYHGVDFTSSECLCVEDSIFFGSERFKRTPRMSLLHFLNSNGQCTANITRVTASNSKFLYAFAIDTSSDRFDIVVDGLNITGRTSDYSLQSLTLDNGLLTFVRMSSVTIKGSDENPCVFEELIGPVLLGRVTDVFLTGNVTFRNIKAASWAGGAAIMLQTDTLLWLQEPLSAEFCNLTAVRGGAIYIPEKTSQFCVIQYLPLNYYTHENISNMDISLTFTGNRAILAGNSLYVDPLWNCSFQLSPKIAINHSEVTMIYDNIFHFEDSVDNKLFEMSSSPRQVCICEDGITNTNTSALNCNLGPHFVNSIMTYPGRQLSLDLIAVNDLRQPVYATVYSVLFQNISRPGFDWEFKYGSDVSQMYGINCTQFNFTILSKNTGRPVTNGFLGLNPDNSPVTLLFPINLHDCPIGFQRTLDGDCHCSPLLENLNVRCDIDTLLIERPQYSWIGIYANGENDTLGYFSEDELDNNVTIGYSSHCPTRYCNDSITYLDISDPDYICRFNRTGVLCGQCSQKLSVVVGDPHCMECSNWWLLTILLYALAGIILVFLLLILRITMATGTITGLIFYANLFNVNSFTFFSFKYVEWIKVFIALLNLELGFPMCLYDGLTELNRAYLSFVFPIYLWTLGLTLVLLARYSFRVASWTARTSVPVLATVIHLTFFKLLRSVVNGLTFSILKIEHSDYTNQTMMVWYYDGSVKYLGNGHCVLFGIALATLLFLISYITVLTGVKYFTRFRIINRFQPLIDAICAPYKDKWRFWHGVRLWAIVVVDITFAASRNDVYLFIYIQTMILMTLTFSQLAIMPYKSMAINVLDLFFLSDATLLTATVLYNDSNTQAASGIFGGVVFIAFWCIIGYHIWILVEKKFSSFFCRRRQDYEALSASANVQDNIPTVTHTDIPHVEPITVERVTHKFDELREPILAPDLD